MQNRTRSIQAVWCALVSSGILAFNIFRAWKQSITYDEATTYLDFVAQPFSTAMQTYDANHHILHTLLCKLSVSVFGVSELSLRTPSLIGGALFLAACAALCLTELVPGPASLAAFPVLVLNPFVLDYLSVARGYGLGLGFFAWAIYCSIRALRDPARRKRWFSTISVLLGLAASSNLTFAFPSLALMIALILLSWTQGRLRIPNASMLLLPGAGLFALVCAFPLAHATGGSFYVGTEKLRDSFNSLAFVTAFYSKGRLGLSGIPADVLGSQWRVLNGLWRLVLGLSGLAAAFSIYHFVKRIRARVPLLTPPAVVIAGLVLVLTLVVLKLAHQWVGVLYPISRTGLYLLFLYTLFVVLMFFGSELVPGLLRAVASVLAAAVSIYWISQLRTDSYLEWRYNVSAKAFMEQIAQAGPLGSPTPAHGISGTWMLMPSARFYQTTHGLTWSGSIDSGGTLLTKAAPARPEGIDYFLLLPEDHPLIDRWHLRVLRSDPASGAKLAAAPVIP